MKIEGETIQKGVPIPDNPVEIINIYKDIDYAVKIVESIRNKVSRINVPEQNKEYDIPFLNSTENQAITTVLYRLSEYSEEINKLNNAIQNIREEFLKYDWENSTKEQICNQLKSLYESIFMKEDK